MVQLKGFRVNSVSFENKVQNGTQLKLKNHFNYNVSYMDGENKCIGTLNFKIADENMLPFEIKLEIVAEFAYQSGDDKGDIHVESFDQLFPSLRQFINSLTATCGMPGLMIPYIALVMKRATSIFATFSLMRTNMQKCFSTTNQNRADISDPT